jgi:uncharacterized damage-inducible protein DinB
MLAEALRTLYGYNRWATERVLEVTSRLASEQLNAPGTAGHGSVRETLLHMLDTHRGWLSWWDGSLSAEDAYNLQTNAADYPDLEAVRGLWESIEAQTQAYVAGLSDADAARVYSHTFANGTAFSMVLWQMMLHVANHGTQHRSEVAAMLTTFGQSPGDLDLLHYVVMANASQTG